MKRATLPCCLQVYYVGDGDGLAGDDPVKIELMLPDGDLFELTGESGNEVRAHMWVSGGWLYKAESIEEVEAQSA